MTQLFKLNPPPSIPADLSKQLRDLADHVDHGDISSIIIALINKHEGDYQFIYGASIRDCLELSTLLQYRCLKRYEA